MSICRLATDTPIIGHCLGLASRMCTSSVPTAPPVVPVPIAVSPVVAALLAAAPVVAVPVAVALSAVPVVAPVVPVPIAVSLSAAPVVLFRLVPVCW